MTSRRRGPPRLLLVSNCQVSGLANCIELLNPRVQVEAFDALALSREGGGVVARLDEFDAIVVSPRVKKHIPVEVADRPGVVWFPHVLFRGYHPDLCYLAGTGPLASGPMGHYHSAIAWAAHTCGLGDEETLSMYREDVYRALGYFDAWQPQRDAMVATFAAHGFDIASLFVKWSRSGPFMYTENHPKIEVLFDLSKLLMKKLGLDTVDAGLVPYDNLAKGPVFPVYPELAGPIGVKGHYQFKPGGKWRLKGLPAFVSESLARYRQVDAGVEPSVEAYLPLLERARAVVEAAR